MIISPASVVVNTAVAAAGAFVVLTLASQCGRNMIQTYRIINSHSNSNNNSNQQLPNIIATANLLSLPSNDADDVDVDVDVDNNDEDYAGEEVEKIIEQIKKLNREQLLQLFINDCVAPNNKSDEAEICGEWNGCLLDNNSKIMTIVSNIMTHNLFSGSLVNDIIPSSLLSFGSGGGGKNNDNNNNNKKKKKTKLLWNGKSFLSNSRGSNRFSIIEHEKNTAKTTKTTTNEKKKKYSSLFFQKHDFDYSLEKSKFVNDETKSISLKYSKYQSSPYTSLWYTMTDELRYITLPTTVYNDNDDDDDDDGEDNGETKRYINKNILIGLGSMSWSGGHLNCSPFVLWRT
jgi:hypothetical protein